RRLRWDYCRLVEKVDAQVGRVLGALRDSGHENDTLVLFTSDHGEGAGAHHWNQKTALWEESIRVPFIARGPGVRRGETDDRLVSNGVDLLPTLCSAAGIDDALSADGRDLLPLLRGESGMAWRNYVAVETTIGLGDGPGGPAVGRALIGQDTKYSNYSMGRHREQLVNLQQDPGEMVNLAVESAHSNLLQQWRQRLRDHCDETQDQAGAGLLA
ncbi:MAG: sulfatase-like hydrolase/transferase, partial [Gemmatimonadetes bacterium]|nr:sulfatase-like hydrolase/transferase [Gemmatimonadota bacterium]